MIVPLQSQIQEIFSELVAQKSQNPHASDMGEIKSALQQIMSGCAALDHRLSASEKQNSQQNAILLQRMTATDIMVGNISNRISEIDQRVNFINANSSSTTVDRQNATDLYVGSLNKKIENLKRLVLQMSQKKSKMHHREVQDVNNYEESL